MSSPQLPGTTLPSSSALGIAKRKRKRRGSKHSSQTKGDTVGSLRSVPSEAGSKGMAAAGSNESIVHGASRSSKGKSRQVDGHRSEQGDGSKSRVLSKKDKERQRNRKKDLKRKAAGRLKHREHSPSSDRKRRRSRSRARSTSPNRRGRSRSKSKSRGRSHSRKRGDSSDDTSSSSEVSSESSSASSDDVSSASEQGERAFRGRSAKRPKLEVAEQLVTFIASTGRQFERVLDSSLTLATARRIIQAKCHLASGTQFRLSAQSSVGGTVFLEDDEDFRAFKHRVLRSNTASALIKVDIAPATSPSSHLSPPALPEWQQPVSPYVLPAVLTPGRNPASVLPPMTSTPAESSQASQRKKPAPRPQQTAADVSQTPIASRVTPRNTRNQADSRPGHHLSPTKSAPTAKSPSAAASPSSQQTTGGFTIDLTRPVNGSPASTSAASPASQDLASCGICDEKPHHALDDCARLKQGGLIYAEKRFKELKDLKAKKKNPQRHAQRALEAWIHQQRETSRSEPSPRRQPSKRNAPEQAPANPGLPDEQDTNNSQPPLPPPSGSKRAKRGRPKATDDAAPMQSSSEVTQAESLAADAQPPKNNVESLPDIDVTSESNAEPPTKRQSFSSPPSTGHEENSSGQKVAEATAPDTSGPNQVGQANGYANGPAGSLANGDDLQTDREGGESKGRRRAKRNDSSAASTAVSKGSRPAPGDDGGKDGDAQGGSGKVGDSKAKTSQTAPSAQSEKENSSAFGTAPSTGVTDVQSKTRTPRQTAPRKEKAEAESSDAKAARKEMAKLHTRWTNCRKDCEAAQQKLVELMKRQQEGETFVGLSRARFSRAKNTFRRRKDQLEALESELSAHSNTHNTERPPRAPELEAAASLLKECGESEEIDSSVQVTHQRRSDQRPAEPAAKVQRPQDTQQQSDHFPTSEDELASQHVGATQNKSANADAPSAQHVFPGLSSPASSEADVETSPNLRSQKDFSRQIDADEDVQENPLPPSRLGHHSDDADDEGSSVVESHDLINAPAAQPRAGQGDLFLGQSQMQSQSQQLSQQHRLPVQSESEDQLSTDVLPSPQGRTHHRTQEGSAVSGLTAVEPSQPPTKAGRRVSAASSSQAGSETSDDSDEDDDNAETSDSEQEEEDESNESDEAEEQNEEMEDIEQSQPSPAQAPRQSREHQEDNDEVPTVSRETRDNDGEDGASDIDSTTSSSTDEEGESDGMSEDPISTFSKGAGEADAPQPDRQVSAGAPQSPNDATEKPRSSGLFSNFNFFQSARNNLNSLKDHGVFTSSQPTASRKDDSSADVSASLANTSLSQPGASNNGHNKYPKFSAPRLTQLNTSSLLKRQSSHGVGAMRSATPLASPSKIPPPNQQALTAGKTNGTKADAESDSDEEGDGDSESESSSDSDSDSNSESDEEQGSQARGKLAQSSNTRGTVVPDSKRAGAAAAAAAKRSKKTRGLADLF